MSRSLFEKIPGLEEQSLLVVIEEEKRAGRPVEKYEARLKELKEKRAKEMAAASK